MERIEKRYLLIAVITLVAAAISTSAWAQARSTPVQVQNPVAVDPNNNTVKALESGVWTVNVSNPLAVTQSGLWNVGISGTPSVNVANSPTVNIDPNNNTIKAPTQHNYVMLFGADQSWAPGAFLYSPGINCAGYKEMRFTIQLASYIGGMDLTKLAVYVRFFAPDGSGAAWTGGATFGAPVHSLTDQSGFTNSDTTCSFTIPVMSDSAFLQMLNSSPYGVTVSRISWVYLVN